MCEKEKSKSKRTMCALISAKVESDLQDSGDKGNGRHQTAGQRLSDGRVIEEALLLPKRSPPT